MFIGVIAGGLTYLTAVPVAGAVVAGLTAAGASVPVLRSLIQSAAYRPVPVVPRPSSKDNRQPPSALHRRSGLGIERHPLPRQCCHDWRAVQKPIGCWTQGLDVDTPGRNRLPASNKGVQQRWASRNA